MVLRVDVGVLSTQKRQKYPYYRVLDWNQIPLYTIMRVVIVTGINQVIAGFLKGMPSAVLNTNVKFLFDRPRFSRLN